MPGNNQPNIDTMINSYATGTLKATLEYNTAVVQYASQLVAAGPIKPSAIKKVQREFKAMRDQYLERTDAISAILNEELKERGISL